jgi:type I restriction enzyme R subunit
MSTLLDEIIAARKARAIEYEEYLKRIAELAKTVEVGKGNDTPATLDTPGKRAIYNNLSLGSSASTDHVAEPAVSYGSETANKVLELSLRIDEAIKRSRPDGWRGIQTREQVIKQALYDVLQDVAEVERIFLVIKAQGEY